MALTNKLTAVANAIRAKTGKSALMTLDEMPTEIGSIGGGGGFDWTQLTTNYFTYTIKSTVTMFTCDGIDSTGWASFAQMFGYNTSVVHIDASALDFSAATDISSIARGNTSLKSINLRSLTTSNVTSSGALFNGDNVLEAVIWAIDSNTVQSLPITNSFRSSSLYNGDGYLYVPDALVNDYKADSGFSEITSHIKGISELPAEYKTLYNIS